VDISTRCRGVTCGNQTKVLRYGVPAQTGRDRLIVALDVPTVDEALQVVERLDNISFFKIGLRLYMAGALSGKLALLVERLRPHGQIFFDLKFPGDIDTTIATVVADYKDSPHVKFLTLNEFMPVAAIRAARLARGDSPTPKLLMVPYLSSLNGTDDLRAVYGEQDFETFLLKRAHAAIDNGCDGLIASGNAIAVFRAAYPKTSGVVIVSPGIRPAGTSTDEHKRFTTPAEAIRLGADYLVVGRPILKSPDPRDAAERIIAEIDAASSTGASGNQAKRHGSSARSSAIHRSASV
jgi:orotidine-5'-phosphate decarboxylase